MPKSAVSSGIVQRIHPRLSGLRAVFATAATTCGPSRSRSDRPRGDILASGGGQGNQRGEVRTWDVAAGKLLFLRYGLSERILSLSYARDGKLAAAGRDGLIRIWEHQLASEALERTPGLIDASTSSGVRRFSA